MLLRAQKTPLTVCLSLRSSGENTSSVCVSVCVRVVVEEVGTLREDFRFFLARTCCEKGGSKAGHMQSKDNPPGANLNHWMLHIFY